jgi:hypothetical protein
VVVVEREEQDKTALPVHLEMAEQQVTHTRRGLLQLVSGTTDTCAAVVAEQAAQVEAEALQGKLLFITPQ